MAKRDVILGSLLAMLASGHNGRSSLAHSAWRKVDRSIIRVYQSAFSELTRRPRLKPSTKLLTDAVKMPLLRPPAKSQPFNRYEVPDH